MMAPTIRDVARRAGVGLGTVSRVINNSSSVSERTRLRVLKVIKELQYTPNPIARQLSLGKTLTISVITPFFTRPAFVERLRGVASALAESEYDLIIYNVESPERRDSCFRQVPQSERTDGVLILSLNPRDRDIEFLAASRIPVVLVDANHPALTGISRLILDDVGGGMLATQHLIDLGHQKIGFIGDQADERLNFSSSLDRKKGYRLALENAGILFRPEYYGEGAHGRYKARGLAWEILTLPDPPTAIFAASDTQAMGIIECARDLGVRVPDDLSIIGYDDIEIAEFLGLTTIRQFLFETGQQGVEMLLRRINNPSVDPILKILHSELVVRETTAPPSTNS